MGHVKIVPYRTHSRTAGWHVKVRNAITGENVITFSTTTARLAEQHKADLERAIASVIAIGAGLVRSETLTELERTGKLAQR